MSVDESSSRGSVYASTIVFVGGGGFQAPYQVAYVDLDSGMRVFGHLESETLVQPGMRVRAQVASKQRSDGTMSEVTILSPVQDEG